MINCNEVRKVLKTIVMRGVFFPLSLVMFPLIFIMSDEDDCKYALEDAKEFVVFCWKGFKENK